jgi:hypothetical protein
MPATLFEFIYSYLYLMGKLGKPPSNTELCKLLEIDNCTGLQRKNRCIALGYIVDPGYLPVGKDWCVLTDKGAEAFTAVLDGVDKVYMADGQYLCVKRDHLPDGIVYSDLSRKEYRQYMKALSDNGYATPT